MHPRSPSSGWNRPHHAQIVQNLPRRVYVSFAHPALLTDELLGELVNHAGGVCLHVERQGHVMHGLGRDPATTTRREDIRLRQCRVDQHSPQRPFGRPAREAVDDCKESEFKLIGFACTVLLNRYRSFRHPVPPSVLGPRRSSAEGAGLAGVINPRRARRDEQGNKRGARLDSQFSTTRRARVGSPTAF